MRGYYMDWEAVMALPIRVFWTLLKQLNRLRAAEELRWFGAVSMAHSTSEEHRRAYMEERSAIIGMPVIQEAFRDLKGIEKLKKLAG